MLRGGSGPQISVRSRGFVHHFEHVTFQGEDVHRRLGALGSAPCFTLTRQTTEILSNGTYKVHRFLFTFSCCVCEHVACSMQVSEMGTFVDDVDLLTI